MTLNHPESSKPASAAATPAPAATATATTAADDNKHLHNCFYARLVIPTSCLGYSAVVAVVAAAGAAAVAAPGGGRGGLTSLGDIDDMFPGCLQAVALYSFYVDFHFHFDVARTRGSGGWGWDWGSQGVSCLMMLCNHFVVVHNLEYLM